MFSSGPQPGDDITCHVTSNGGRVVHVDDGGWHDGDRQHQANDPLGRLPSIEGYLIDSSLAWRASAKTSFLLTVRSDFYDTTAANSPGTLSREVGVEMRHAFQRYLIGSVAARFAKSPYENLSLEDKLFTGELGLDYYVNANVSVYGRLQHLDFQSTDTSRNYIDDIVRVGIRVRQ